MITYICILFNIFGITYRVTYAESKECRVYTYTQGFRMRIISSTGSQIWLCESCYRTIMGNWIVKVTMLFGISVFRCWMSYTKAKYVSAILPAGFPQLTSARYYERWTLHYNLHSEYIYFYVPTISLRTRAWPSPWCLRRERNFGSSTSNKISPSLYRFSWASFW